MEQFEQLLTCAICLDRYRNPKLLPCQHSFCMEPCMDGLVDYVRRQVKCPECRAEHRIPYQGVQGYPTNVTLQRFLELHIEITGELPDPTSGQIMKRCSVCSEKAYCTLCLHCDKEICPECKSAHKDILKREISRINNQIRRALHRLEDILSHVEKNVQTLQQSCTSVSEEIEEIYSRLSKALKDRTEYLRNEIDKYLTSEHKNLSSLKENLEVELSNIKSNCDLADKYMQNELVDWDDCELMDAKEIFLKTVEFIRYFESEPVDYARRAKFVMNHEPNQLLTHLANYGDISINHQSVSAGGASGNLHHSLFAGGSSLANSGSNVSSSGAFLQPPVGPGLMRSKSDHRLTSQYHRQQQEERGGGGYDGPSTDASGGRISPLGGRKFGERYPGSRGSAVTSASAASGIDRYGRIDYSSGADFESPYDNESGRSSRSSRLRSRLARYGAAGANENADSDTDIQGLKSVRFSDAPSTTHGAAHPRDRERERVLDTEDVAKGPISGITRLYDSPRVMKRIQESENKVQKEKKNEQKEVQQQQQQTTVNNNNRLLAQQMNSNSPPLMPPSGGQQRRSSNSSQLLSRQISEEDEISRIKRQNKTPGPSSAANNNQTGTETFANNNNVRRQSVDRMYNSRREGSLDERTARATTNSDTDHHTRRTPIQQVTMSSEDNSEGNDEQEQGPLTGHTQKHQTAVKSATGLINSKRPSTSSDTMTQLSDSCHKNVTSPSSSHGKQKSNSTNADSETVNSKRNDADDDEDNNEDENDEEDESTSTSSSTGSSNSSETETEESEGEEEVLSKTDQSDRKMSMDKTDIGPLLARSAQARDVVGNDGASSSNPGTGTAFAARRSSAGGRDDGYSTAYRYNSNIYPYPSSRDSTNTGGSGYSGSRSNTSAGGKYLTRKSSDDSSTSEPKSRFTSRFLNKNKSNSATNSTSTGIDDNDHQQNSRQYGSSSTSGGGPSSSASAGTGRDRYVTFKDRKARLARSKSTHGFGTDDLPDTVTDENTVPNYYPSSYLTNKGSSSGSSHANSDLTRSRSSHHVLKSRENSPEHQFNSGTEKDGSSLSSWARYLKNKYGSRGKDSKDSCLVSTPSPSSAAMARRLSLGLPLRHNSSNLESSDDDQKNMIGSPNSPTTNTAAQVGFTEVGTTLRSQYMQKRQLLFKIGSRGSEPGHFTWPRGIAVGPDNIIVVADSSNHRVQVFDQNGKFLKEFGSYGNREGEFDCLAGIAVNRIGQFIIADRYNHRIQVLDPSGRFLRSFGSQGTTDGKFNYPWGITTDALGFIYVCDKENHRVQVFQSDGTFVGKFGSCGNKIGQLEHPHYIAVSTTNRVIVSDSNNHRVQIFDVNGRILSSIGSEGSANGQFKFPRGVAVDDQGYILVGDSGNNRIQIFHPDGTFLRAFGCWGSGDGEFKGLEGIAVMSNGNILICDRENHRIQAF